MEKFKESITNYIEKEENFALFIDGEWGTGKTHFFERNYFFNNINENQNRRNYKKEYISVYGKHSLKQIQEIIVTKLLSHVDHNVISDNLKKGLSNIFKILDLKYVNNENIAVSIDDYLEVTAIDQIKDNLNKHGDKVVLIIDDLERLSDDISIKEFLGFIRNILLDSFNCKVILIGNKDALNKENEKEMADYREKVISRTLKFPSNLEVGENILEAELDEILKENEIDDLKELIHLSSLSRPESNTLNLRTLKLVITDFKNLYNQLEDSHKQKANTRMSLFTSLFILHNINRNNETEDEKDFYGLSAFYVAPLINNKESQKELNKKKIHYKYFKDNKVARNYAYLSNELKKYILEGNLDIREYQKQINNNFSDKKAEEDTLNILREFYFYSEEKILSQEKRAIEIINENSYAFGYRLNLYISLNMLDDKEMLFIKNCDLNKLEEILLSSFELQKTNNAGGEFITDLTHYDFSTNEKLSKLKKDLSIKLRKKQEESMISKGIYELYIESILKVDRKTMNKLEQDYREVLNLDIFEKFNEYIHHVKKTLLKNNANIIELNRYLTSIQMDHTTHDNVKQFKQNINDIKTTVKDKITEYNFNTLIETLDENMKIFDQKKD